MYSLNVKSMFVIPSFTTIYLFSISGESVSFSPPVGATILAQLLNNSR